MDRALENAIGHGHDSDIGCLIEAAERVRASEKPNDTVTKAICNATGSSLRKICALE